MQQLIDVQTVIKRTVLISAMGEIGFPDAWPKCRAEEWAEDVMEERNGVMDVWGIKDKLAYKGRYGML